MPSFHLYIKPGCSWCTDAVAHFDSEGFDYEKIDVISDSAAFDEMRSLSGQSLAPTLVVDRGEPSQKVLPDFGVDELAVFFGEHGLEP